MKKSNTVILLFLIAVLFTVFGSAAAQDANAPAFMVSSVVPDEKVVLSTKNFPAETDYTISMADPADQDYPLFQYLASGEAKLEKLYEAFPSFPIEEVREVYKSLHRDYESDVEMITIKTNCS